MTCPVAEFAQEMQDRVGGLLRRILRNQIADLESQISLICRWKKLLSIFQAVSAVFYGISYAILWSIDWPMLGALLLISWIPILIYNRKKHKELSNRLIKARIALDKNKEDYAKLMSGDDVVEHQLPTIH